MLLFLRGWVCTVYCVVQRNKDERVLFHVLNFSNIVMTLVIMLTNKLKKLLHLAGADCRNVMRLSLFIYINLLFRLSFLLILICLSMKTRQFFLVYCSCIFPHLNGKSLIVIVRIQ